MLILEEVAEARLRKIGRHTAGARCLHDLARVLSRIGVIHQGEWPGAPRMMTGRAVLQKERRDVMREGRRRGVLTREAQAERECDRAKSENTPHSSSQR